MSFLDNTGRGVIRKLLDKKNAEVETDEGFLITCLLAKLAPYRDFPDYKLVWSEEEKFIRGKLKDSSTPRIHRKNPKKESLLEVDLHIYELIDDLRGISNGDMLRIQLGHFRKKMAEARKKGIEKIVFIHGVGEGVLRSEIRHALLRYEEVVEVLDASYEKYGAGATEVRLRYPR